MFRNRAAEDCVGGGQLLAGDKHDEAARSADGDMLQQPERMQLNYPSMAAFEYYRIEQGAAIILCHCALNWKDSIQAKYHRGSVSVQTSESAGFSSVRTRRYSNGLYRVYRTIPAGCGKALSSRISRQNDDGIHHLVHVSIYNFHLHPRLSATESQHG